MVVLGCERRHDKPERDAMTTARVVAAQKVFARAAGAVAPRGGAARCPALGLLRPAQRIAAGQLQQSRTFFSKERSKSVYEYGAHRSDAEAKIAEVPVVLVDGPVALCEGGEDHKKNGTVGRAWVQQ